MDEYFTCDLTEGFPSGAITGRILHLAGLAAVGPSFHESQRYVETNSAMVTHICESVLAEQAGQSIRILGVSSGAVYDSSATLEPICETSALRMSSPYVVSKVLLENQLSYYRSRGLSTVTVRPFNHIGPFQSRGFLLPDLFSAIQDLPSGEPLRVGNLQTARDYLDVRDVARAYLALLEAESPRYDVYNVCSGEAHSGEQILRILCDSLGIAVPLVEIDEQRIRPNDARSIVGSASRLRDELGWSPTFSITESIRDFVSAAA